jgi:hypothetical protein
VLYDRQDVDAFIRSGRQETSGVVLALGPERPPVGSGALSTVRQTASQGVPEVPAQGNLSADFSDGSGDGA